MQKKQNLDLDIFISFITPLISFVDAFISEKDKQISHNSQEKL
jgi:hypothetical protein